MLLQSCIITCIFTMYTCVTIHFTMDTALISLNTKKSNVLYSYMYHYFAMLLLLLLRVKLTKMSFQF